jgi:hypothetical protein
LLGCVAAPAYDYVGISQNCGAGIAYSGNKSNHDGSHAETCRVSRCLNCAFHVSNAGKEIERRIPDRRRLRPELRVFLRRVPERVSAGPNTSAFSAGWIAHIERVVPHVSVEVQIVLIADGISLQEAAQRR